VTIDEAKIKGVVCYQLFQFAPVMPNLLGGSRLLCGYRFEGFVLINSNCKKRRKSHGSRFNAWKWLLERRYTG
jgi:hypothetical protein